MPDGGDRIQRCCPRHDGLRQLCEHIARDFPELALAVVAREFERARSAVAAMRADDDGLVVTELIVRNQLLLFTGERADHAHLQPQVHPQRGAAGRTETTP